MAQNKVVSESGATSSHLAPAFDVIRPEFFERIGNRFGLGNVTHGRGNFLRCISDDGLVDHKFLRDRYNHAISHLLSLKVQDSRDDDNLAAVGWFLAFAVHMEVLGVDWQEVLRVRTPEEEATLQIRIRGVQPNELLSQSGKHPVTDSRNSQRDCADAESIGPAESARYYGQGRG